MLLNYLYICIYAYLYDICCLPGENTTIVNQAGKPKNSNNILKPKKNRMPSWAPPTMSYIVIYGVSSPIYGTMKVNQGFICGIVHMWNCTLLGWDAHHMNIIWTSPRVDRWTAQVSYTGPTKRPGDPAGTDAWISQVATDLSQSQAARMIWDVGATKTATTQYWWENKKLMATKPPTSHPYLTVIGFPFPVKSSSGSRYPHGSGNHWKPETDGAEINGPPGDIPAGEVFVPSRLK